jgi:aminoglycoside phosphotransferase (APT) family kinase protein
MDLVERYGRKAYATEILIDRRGRCVAKVTTDLGPVVVKVATRRAAFAPEVAAIELLRAAGLPVPDVVGSSDEPPAHIVLSWLDGVGLSSASPVAAQRAAGRLLRRVHALPGGPPYAGNATIDVWMAGWLNHALGWWREYAGASAEAVEKIWEWYANLRPLLATRGDAATLFDGRPEHFIVVGDDVAGMIDLCEVSSGDPAMDLAVIAVDDPALLTGVLAGYAPTPDETRAFDRLIPFYLFLRRLARAEWQLHYGDPAETDRLIAQLAGGTSDLVPPAGDAL